MTFRATASGSVVERISVHSGSLFFHEHLARYAFARERVRPGRVLDIACGTGYGTHLFATTPGVWCLGVDLDQPAVFDARRAYPEPSVNFSIARGDGLPFPSGTFESIVSLETIEHVEDDRGLLRDFVRVLAPDGVVILSTPNREYSIEHRVINPYHVREYFEAELRHLLQAFFGHVAFAYQGFSPHYRAELNGYSASIQARRNSLGAPLRLILDRAYDPVKKRLPTRLKDFFIRRLVRLRFPQPDPRDIVIASEPMLGMSNFVVVCEQPLAATR